MAVILTVLALVALWVMFYGDESELGQAVGLLVLLAGVVFAFILLGAGLGWI